MLFTKYAGRDKRFGWVISHVPTSVGKLSLEDRAWPVLTSAVALAIIDHVPIHHLSMDTDEGFATHHLSLLVKEAKEIAKHLAEARHRGPYIKPWTDMYKANTTELAEMFTELHVPECFPQDVVGRTVPIPDMMRAVIRTGECEAVHEVPLHLVHGWPRSYPDAYYQDLRKHKAQSEIARLSLDDILSKHM